MTARRVLVVAGPTCSGKSGLAMHLAEHLGGLVINADAMQSYADLRILTARPSTADEARVPHALYGVRDAANPTTVAWWRAAALAVIAATDRLPILCGGTGLYLDALLHGLAEIPEPGPAARAEARALLAVDGPEVLHARLAAADPATAARLRPSDSQRVVRAWEVLAGTGRGLAAWQAGAGQGAPAFDTRAIILQPNRATLSAAIAARWDRMIALGAVAEVHSLRARDLDPTLPLLRAHGVRELSSFLDGALTLTQAGARTVLLTRQYTRRQATWLRHHKLAPDARTFNVNARWEIEAQQNTIDMAALHDFVSWPD